MSVDQHYTILFEEATRITSMLIKNRRTDKSMFTLIDEFMDPKFKDDDITISAMIPTLLACYFYYSIESIEPFRIKSFKTKNSTF